MIDPRVVEEVLSRIGSLLPPGLDRVQEDTARGLRAAVSGALERMNLVSREEFDVQVAVLARTRERLETLERRVQALEHRLEELGQA